MSNHPASSNSSSPRTSAVYSLQPRETLPQAPKSSGSNPDLESVDRLSPLPRNQDSPSPYRTVQTERTAIPLSPSAPSLQGLLAARSFPISPESRDVRSSPAASSVGRYSYQQRIFFEGGRVSAPSPNHSPRTTASIHPLLRDSPSHPTRGIESTITGMNRSNGSSAQRLPGATNSSPKLGHESSPIASPPHSRTASPLRRFGWSPFHHTHEDAFVPVDPFRLRSRLCRLSHPTPDIENHLHLDPTCEQSLCCCTTPWRCDPKGRFPSFLRDARDFTLDTLPRQIYLCLLLRLPSLYFSRIARLYEDSQLSKPDLESMIVSYSTSRQLQERERVIRSSPILPSVHHQHYLPFPDEWTATNVSPALLRFKQSWEALIDSLLREWKTLNLVSALLLSAIITIFQSPTMANDPIIRTAALLSLSSALMSLSYGCMYIVRFGTMRSMYKATRWAEEAARTTTHILWNVWVLLAMPVVWLSWSMIFFIVAILAFVWRYGSSADPASPPLLSPTAALGTRIAVSVLFFIGFVYLTLIINTLYNYGRTVQDIISMAATPARAGLSGVRADDAQGERESQREPSREPARATRGRERTRAGQGRDAADPGVLPAMTGLGLTGLDDVVRPPSSDEIPIQK